MLQHRQAPVRAAAAAIGLTAATVVVAMAGRAPLSPSSAVNAASARAPSLALLLLLVGAGVVVLAAMLALALSGYRRAADDEPEFAAPAPHVHWLWKLLAILVPFALGAALVAAAVLGEKIVHPTPRILGGGPLGPSHGAPLARRGDGSSNFVVQSWLPWTVLAIVIVAVTAGIFLLLRRGHPLADEHSERIAARAAVQAAIGALDTDVDPRSAVIAAYGAMEGTLAAHGVARSPAEAPREYLRRVLTSSSVSEPEARTLTELFEEARFSTHAIPERGRALALSALGALREQLQLDGAR